MAAKPTTYQWHAPWKAEAGRHILSEHHSEGYSSIADDAERSVQKREAALLLSVAEQRFDDEEDWAAAAQSAKNAVESFRMIGDKQGIADALRVQIDALRMKAGKLGLKPDEAMQLAISELAAAKQNGDECLQAATLLALGKLNANKLGNKFRDEGLRQVKESIRMYREAGNKKMEATALVASVEILVTGNSPAEAIGGVNKALELFQELHDKRGEGRCLHELGVARCRNEQYEAGLQAMEGALRIARELGNKKLEALELHSIAQLRLKEGAPREALAAAREAIALCEVLGFGQGFHTEALCMLIRGLLANEEPDAAVKTARKFLLGVREHGNQVGEVEALDILSNTLLENDDADVALPRAEEGVALARELKDPRREATLLLTVSQVQLRRKEFGDALAACKEAIPLFHDLDDPVGEGNAHQIVMELHFARERVADAMNAGREARSLFGKGGDGHSEARMLLAMASLHRIQEEDSEAVSAATEAQFLFQKEKDRAWEAKALAEVAEIHAFNDNYGSALRAAKKALALVQELEDKTNLAALLSMAGLVKLSAFVDHAVVLSTDKKAQTWDRDMASDTIKSLESAKVASDKIGDRKLTIANLLGMAQALIVTRRLGEANVQISDAEDLCLKAASSKDKDRDLSFFQEGQVICMILATYCSVLENDDKKGAEMADKALKLAKDINDLRGEFLSNNIKEIIAKRAGAGEAGEGEEEMAVDPEMLKLKIQDVANSLMGIESLAGDTPLMDAGLDSLSMVEFRNELVKEFPGVDLPGALLFDYPTVNALTEYVSEGIKRTGNALK